MRAVANDRRPDFPLAHGVSAARPASTGQSLNVRQSGSVAESWEREMNVLKRCCAVDSDITFFAAEILRRGRTNRTSTFSFPGPTFDRTWVCDVSSASKCQDTVRSTIDQRMNLRVQ